jgi:two-component system LytT family response regulator
MPIKTILLDDEPDAVKLLQLQINKHCPELEIMTTFTNPELAVQSIKTSPPDLLLIDVEMPKLNGFDVLEKISPIDFNVIFVTAYDQYAIRAFKYNAIDYLLKPIDTTELKNAIDRAKQRAHISAIEIGLIKQLRLEKTIDKIAVSTQNGISFIDLKDIIFAESKNNYSVLTLSNKSTFTISKTLKDLQELLEESHFLRIHRQYIINLNEVFHFNKTDCILTLKNNQKIPVARNKKDALVEMYKNI